MSLDSYDVQNMGNSWGLGPGHSVKGAGETNRRNDHYNENGVEQEIKQGGVHIFELDFHMPSAGIGIGGMLLLIGSLFIARWAYLKCRCRGDRNNSPNSVYQPPPYQDNRDAQPPTITSSSATSPPPPQPAVQQPQIAASQPPTVQQPYSIAYSAIPNLPEQQQIRIQQLPILPPNYVRISSPLRHLLNAQGQPTEPKAIDFQCQVNQTNSLPGFDFSA